MKKAISTALALAFLTFALIPPVTAHQVGKGNRKATPSQADRVVYPTRSTLPHSWVSYDLKEGFGYGGPDVRNEILFEYGTRYHWFYADDFTFGMATGGQPDAVDPGFREENKRAYVDAVNRHSGDRLVMRTLAYNILELDEVRWLGGKETARKPRYQKMRMYKVGGLMVSFIIRSTKPLGPAAREAMRNFAGTFAIEDSLAESLASRYEAAGYVVELSHRPAKVPSTKTRF